MDNNSRRQSSEDTTTSMYLSFDAESTMSTACYKTLEAMSDNSALSINGANDSVDQKIGNSKINSTLGFHENSLNISPLKTVKKIEMQVGKLSTPLRVLPKNVFREYKAMCSTPARELLLKTVDVTRGSDASRCVDLGLAFLGVDDEHPAFFSTHTVGMNEENKENALPDAEEVSTLSTCSSVEIATSVIEKKMLSSMSTVGSITEEEFVEDIKISQNVEKDRVSSVDMVDESMEVNSKLDANKAFKSEDETKNLMQLKKENLETTPKAKIDDVKYLSIIKQSLAIQEGNTSLVKEETISVDMVDKILKVNSILVDAKNAFESKEEPINKIKFNMENPAITPPTAMIDDIKCVGIIKDSLQIEEDKSSGGKDVKIEGKHINMNSYKTKSSALTRNVRRSVCEPNLQMNKPSRILNSDRRRSLLPTCKKSTLNMDAEDEIPLLMSRMLKITNTQLETEEDHTLKEKETVKNSNAGDKTRPVLASMKTRATLIPPASVNKRPFSFNQRMSVLVKTTLNSPARKIARKGSIGGLTSLQRKCTIAQKTTTDDSKAKKTEILSRKSMLPKTYDINLNTQSNAKIINSLQETSTKPTCITAHRKSLYPLASSNEKGVLNTNANMSNKPVISYACNVCKERFRVKSLLDAHKRSHESDNRPPAFIKKPLTINQPMSGTMLGNSNQCKYCDKKFALLKALHIHLLQNCSKIPPSEKRKLQYTDLNHVQKAQLPVFTYNSLQSSASSSVSSVSDAPRYTLKQNITRSSSETVNENKDKPKITSYLTTTVSGNNVTASQATVKKFKKITAHAGVYMTPSKSVPCHLCKLTFKSILDYTNHNLATHGSCKASADDTGTSI